MRKCVPNNVRWRLLQVPLSIRQGKGRVIARPSQLEGQKSCSVLPV